MIRKTRCTDSLVVVISRTKSNSAMSGENRTYRSVIAANTNSAMKISPMTG